MGAVIDNNNSFVKNLQKAIDTGYAAYTSNNNDMIEIEVESGMIMIYVNDFPVLSSLI